ncbi:LysR family transcriptional regulator [Pandoraea terrae]|uniref:LysR family transcriptional regulator n=1 Tax=Pandoraea terrae TaxID=1537710 RepID=A0A5E4UV33_9BURK|nr:LysR family transcriptional regulator [Pandoraea terrae]
MAAPNPALVPIPADEIVLTRHFWLSSREDLRKLRRMTALWDYLRAATADANRALLMGESSEMRYVNP